MFSFEQYRLMNNISYDIGWDLFGSVGLVRGLRGIYRRRDCKIMIIIKDTTEIHVNYLL
jgi:hypothetical protein